MDEEHPLNARSPYAATKAGGDRLAYAYFVTYDLPIVIVRPFNNYGPRQHPEKVIPRFIIQALAGEALTVHGDGHASRDWLWVDDHAEALEALIDAPIERVAGEVVNIATGIDISVVRDRGLVLDAVGNPEATVEHVDERPGPGRPAYRLDRQVERLTGWRARTSFADGLERTVAWYRENEVWWREIAPARRPRLLVLGAGAGAARAARSRARARTSGDRRRSRSAGAGFALRGRACGDLDRRRAGARAARAGERVDGIDLARSRLGRRRRGTDCRAMGLASSDRCCDGRSRRRSRASGSVSRRPACRSRACFRGPGEDAVDSLRRQAAGPAGSARSVDGPRARRAGGGGRGRRRGSRGGRIWSRSSSKGPRSRSTPSRSTATSCRWR